MGEAPDGSVGAGGAGGGVGARGRQGRRLGGGRRREDGGGAGRVRGGQGGDRLDEDARGVLVLAAGIGRLLGFRAPAGRLAELVDVRLQVDVDRDECLDGGWRGGAVGPGGE